MPKHLRRSRSSGRLLDRILNTPQLARVVPQLQPQVLHRLIQHCGLEDCGELLTLVTPGQLTRVFDLDLWRAATPGGDEQFDAGRFGTWLEVMVDTGVSSAASTLAAMDVDLLAAAFVQHVRVFDYAAVAPFITIDGEVTAGASFSDGVRAEIGGYVVIAKRLEHWDAITAVLNALADEHGVVFGRVMRGCCRLSNSRPEIDGLDDLLTANEQAMFDEGLDREARGDTQGYVTPAQARTFLQISRRIDRRQASAPPRDPITAAYFRDTEAQSATAADGESPPARDDVPEQSPEAIAAIVELLQDAGVIPGPARALLEAPEHVTTTPRLARIHAQLEYVQDHDTDAYAIRNTELAYLANAIAAGATIQSRSVPAEEAAEAVMAICNLGLENWPDGWLRGDGGAPGREALLIDHDLVTVFQVGCTVLHEDVCMFAADELVRVLTSLHCVDPEIQAGLEALRRTLLRHARAGAPWDARPALDVLTALDMPAWAALLSLIDQLPTMHAAVSATVTGATRPIEASAFEFISENAQIQQVRDFMRLLPDRLA
ncbi:MAG TPA: DUF6178 family protein [Vicinamibacterales bacterium]